MTLSTLEKNEICLKNSLSNDFALLRRMCMGRFVA